MAWTYENASGYMLGNPSKLRVMLFEIMRAINQREAILYGIEQSRFRTAAGAFTSFPTMEQLYLMPMTSGIGTHGNLMRQNMLGIGSTVKSLANSGWFFETGDFGSPAWNIESVSEAIGFDLGSMANAPEAVTDASWWQAIMDTLSLLYYTKTVVFVPGDEPFVIERSDTYKQAIHYPDPDSAWSAMLSDPEQTRTGLGPPNYPNGNWVYFNVGPDNRDLTAYGAGSISQAHAVYRLSSLPGVCTSVDARVYFGDFHSEADTYTGGPWTVRVSVGSNTHTFVTSGIDEGYPYELPLSEFNVEGDTTISITKLSPGLPGSYPFFPSEHVEEYGAGYYFRIFPEFCMDISSSLDDRA